MEDISIFVDSVNGVLIAQDETKLVEEVMKKIVGYSPIEIPSEMKEASFFTYKCYKTKVVLLLSLCCKYCNLNFINQEILYVDSHATN